MTTEQVEDVIRALTAVVENLEPCEAKQSMQEAFMQVSAYAAETRGQLLGKGRPATTVKPEL
jgi:hypothetical protein